MGTSREDEQTFGDAGVSAPERPQGAQLPEELTSFIGRSAELGRVRQLLGEAQLLTLVGSGGCGKTRLAIKGAAAARDRFPHGVWWIELAALADGELLPATVASALGLRERPGMTPVETLLEHLSERHALLVFDNCEHLLEASAKLLEALLQSCHGLVVLATSRAELGVAGELVYRVPSLSLPEESAEPAQLVRADAVRLFLDRASHARLSFALTEDNAPAIAAICRELDGIPLAIELAAARVRMLGPDRIARELDDRFRLLTGGGRTVAPRHATLRASIEWSHDLCSDDERVLLRRLAVWIGGFTLDGAEAVSADAALERRAVLEPLTGLVDKSLVDTEERAGEIRFRMLETIRQYARERLVDAGELDVTHERHLSWCTQLAERAEPELVRHGAARWLVQLGFEAANLRAALDWGIRHDGHAALRLAAALTFFWLMRGRVEEGAAALVRAFEVAPEPSAVRAKALWGLAYLSIWRGEFQACVSYAQRALDDAEEVGDRGVMARALTAQALVRSVTNPVAGRPAVERAVELARGVADRWGTADAMRVLGGGYVVQSEHDAARAILEEGYALARELGYRPFYSWYFHYLATGELEHGRVRAARELAQQGAAISREIGEPVMLGGATVRLVECDVLEGAASEGRRRAEAFLGLIRNAGVRSAEIWVANALALADVAEGRPDAARERVQNTLPLIDTAPAYNNVWPARRALGMACLLLGDLDAAAGEAQFLLAHAEAGRNEHVEAIARDLLGRIALADGRLIEADRHLHDALAIAARRDFRPQTLATLESLARVAARTDSPEEAARLLAAVRAGREQLGIVRWPPETETWASLEAEVREALGDEAFAGACAQGAELAVDEAVQYASRARGSRKRPSRGWESLTPTELEVVRHAAAGLTNPQIGERMFIARATVKAHLSHIFAKLGTSSRTELAAEAARRGLGPRGEKNA